MYKQLITLALIILALSSCKSPQQITKEPQWFPMAIAEDVDILVDTTSIVHKDAIAYATEMRVYKTDEAKQKYVDKIRTEYAKMNKAEKANKWDDFSYCIYHCVYECTDKRFMVLSVEDFDSTGKRIAKTTPAKGKERWLNIESETVGDYTFFFVCDYE